MSLIESGYEVSEIMNMDINMDFSPKQKIEKAKVMANQGDLGVALEEFDGLIREGIESEEVSFWTARIFLAKRQYEHALNELNNLKERASPKVQQLKIELLLVMGRRDEALKLYDRSFADESVPMAKLTQGMIYFYTSQKNKCYDIVSSLPVKMKNKRAELVRNYWKVKSYPKAQSLLTEKEKMATWFGPTKVSIICISYNHEQYIEDCLSTLLSQETDFPYEIIIHDDASTDSTTNVIEKYRSLYPNIIKTILQKENQFSKGVKPQSVAAKESKAKYLAFCEGDDFWLNKWKLQLQHDVLEKNSSAFSCVHGHHPFNEISGTSKENLNISIENVESLLINRKNVIRRKMPLPKMNTVMHRNTADIKLFHPDIMENFIVSDQPRASLMGRLGDTVLLKNFPASAYRINTGSMWTTMPESEKKMHNCSWRIWLSIYYIETGFKEDGFFFYNKVKKDIQEIEGMIKEESLSGYYVNKFCDGVSKLQRLLDEN